MLQVNIVKCVRSKIGPIERTRKNVLNFQEKQKTTLQLSCNLSRLDALVMHMTNALQPFERLKVQLCP